jgi:hypothetical protein
VHYLISESQTGVAPGEGEPSIARQRPRQPKKLVKRRRAETRRVTSETGTILTSSVEIGQDHELEDLRELRRSRESS